MPHLPALAPDALDAHGHADLGPVLAPEDCARLVALYDDDARFRNTIDMARHGFGQGEYKYFADPLPEPVAALRADLYRRLRPVALAWAAALGTGETYPETHAAYRALCHRAGQTRPTPLLLRYREGDHNCLHQDLYGAVSFPIQAVVLLSDPGDFEGGEFVLTVQRPRRQSRAEVVPLAQGHAVAFAVHHRPAWGARGVFRLTQRHGVSRLRAGERLTLGIILHDAT